MPEMKLALASNPAGGANHWEAVLRLLEARAWSDLFRLEDARARGLDPRANRVMIKLKLLVPNSCCFDCRGLILNK